MSIEETYVVGRPVDAPLERFGRYTLFHELAPGGMAFVHVAKKDGADEPCVLKRLHVHLEQQAQVKRRFLREADVASQLMHDNIARVLDAGFEDDVFYMAVELVAGQDVGTLAHQLSLSGNKLHHQLVSCIGLQALEGLSYAHEAVDGEGQPLGVVHRDLSSRNLMVDYDGRVKLIDFGLVRTTAGDPLTAVGVLLGTPRYMSPEQAATDPVDLRSDLFSLGVVLYELLSGQVPFRGNQPLEVLRNVLTHIPPPLSQVAPDVPPAVSDVIARAMEKSASDRFASAREFADALRAASGVSVEAARPFVAEMMQSLFSREMTQMERLTSGARQGTGITPVSPVAMSDPQRAERTITRTAAHAAELAPVTVARSASLVPPPVPPSTNARTIVQLVLAAIAGGLTVGVVMIALLRDPSPRPSPAPPPPAPAKVAAVESPVAVEQPDPPPPIPLAKREPKKSRPRPKTSRPAPPPAPPVVKLTAQPEPKKDTLPVLVRKVEASEASAKEILQVCRALRKRAKSASKAAQKRAKSPLGLGCAGQRPHKNLPLAYRALTET